MFKKILRAVFPRPTMAGLVDNLTKQSRKILEEQNMIISEQEAKIEKARAEQRVAEKEAMAAQNFITGINNMVNKGE